MNFPSKTVPWTHQIKAFEFAKDRDGTLLAPDMGTGKSMIAIALQQYWESKKILIICPKAGIGVWPREFKKHSIYEYKILTLDSGTVEDRGCRLNEFLRTEKDNKVAVINYDSFWIGKVRGEILDGNFDSVIFDECHRLKSAGGKASRFASYLCKTIPKRLGLSGTPMPHSPRDIYAQARSICPEIFGTSKTSFELQYCIKGGFGNYQVLGYQNQDDFKRKLDQFMFQVSKEEALDLPEQINVALPFSLEGEIKDIYKKLNRDFYIELDRGEVTASNALVKLLRLQQITSGFVKDDDGKHIIIGNGKIMLLMDVLSDIPASIPVIVFCRFKKDIEMVKDVAKKTGRIYGEISGARKDLTCEATMPKNITLMAVQMGAGSESIDLTRASIGIIYSPTLSRGEYEQCLARLHRPPQINKVTFYHLIARNTVDEKIYRAFEKGKNIVESILNREV